MKSEHVSRWARVAGGVLLIMSMVEPSYAGPSRALIQEMGSVIGAEEVNVDVDWVGQNLNVIGASDTTVGNGNATVGGIVLSSVNLGLTEHVELRIGRLPGLRSYLTLPVGSGNNYGLTLKGGGFVPGLGVWFGYGSSSLKDMNPSDSAGDGKGSSLRVGTAYTWAGPFVINGSIAYGSDTASVAGAAAPDTTAIEAAVAALYPFRPTLLVGVELDYAKIGVDTTPNKTDLTVLIPALGARAVAGNWTIDAVVALLSTGVGVASGSTNETAKATVIGVPNLRMNYKF
ncbi:MAG: hypothetical protein HY207_12020 [Nitrospirae bacterium]|nr:hypothetical protein [Nitrospirota bacterium]